MNQETTPDGASSRGLLTWRNAGRAIALAVVAVVLYSIYVACIYGPDPQDTFLLGQSTLYADSPAALRVLVTNGATGRPVANAKVRIALEGSTGRHELGRFATGGDGSVDGSFKLPPVSEGDYKLLVSVRSRAGRDFIERPVTVTWPSRVYVTTDKPVYQPGQTIHMRSMALHRTTLRPSAGRKVSFEVQDPKGNKVFRQTRATSRYGIASADFQLAREVNLGRYRVRVVAGGEEFEKVVTVKHYVLPKFRVAVETDKPYYLPGEELRGTVRASYFFGKPVANGIVKIELRTMGEKPLHLKHFVAKTDRLGVFAFRDRLPERFLGMPLSGRDGRLEVEAQVTDTAGHSQVSALHLRVSKDRIKIALLPESGDPVPGVENLFYVVTSYPDGRPARCRLTVNGSQQRTDASGLASVGIVPGKEGVNVVVKASDERGNSARLEQRFKLGDRTTRFLLRTDRAVYAGGGVLTATVLSTSQRNTYFLDIIKDGQTLLTKSVEVRRGRGSVAFTLPPTVFGTLRINAYAVTNDGESRADTRVVFVKQQRELRIQARTDKSTYRPGETAKVTFSVKTASGEPTPAALGVCAVDEAVFHVTESRAGLLQQFFMADKDVLTPAYQLKFFASPRRLLSGAQQDQKLALAAFSSAATPKKQGLSLKDLEGKYIEKHFVERFRRELADGRYDYHLNRREDTYLDGVRKLLRPEGDYTLRARTYPDKVEEAEGVRGRYFERLKASLWIILFGAIALSPLGVFLYSTTRLTEGPTVDPIASSVRRAMRGLSHSTGAMILFPFVTYPGALALGESPLAPVRTETLLSYTVAANFVFVVAILTYQFALCSGIRKIQETCRFGAVMMRVPTAFTALYVATTPLVFLATRDLVDGGVGVVSVLATLVFSLLMACVVQAIAAEAGARYGFGRPTGCGVLNLAVFIVILVILAGMLLPALARAREEGRRSIARSDLGQLEKALVAYEDVNPPQEGKRAGSGASPRIRRFFPETLLWRPEVITDEKGRATLQVPLADSITSWRMDVDAISSRGMLGGTSRGIRVFQDFFVDLDLPVALIQNDEISLPVACYNYLKQPQTVWLKLNAGKGCKLLGPPQKTVELRPNEVKSVHFRIKAVDVGTHALTVMARGGRMSDAIQRRIRVEPSGTEVAGVRSGNLSGSLEHIFVLPPEAIRNSHSLLLKVFPTQFSEVVEGLESVFRMPFGCFEQTSSCTYPNVMALLYLKRTRKTTPEVEVKARKFINAGYQRLLTFEVAGGGFDWFGRHPANIVLTAYGILEFTDMSRVHDVDPAVIGRAEKWLFSKQRANGAWVPQRAAGTWRAVSGELITTAYVAWALAEAQCRGKEMDAALNYLRAHAADTRDAYTLALSANALLGHAANDTLGKKLASRLRSQFTVEKDVAYVRAKGVGATYSRGRCLDVETTALAALALMKDGGHPDVVRKSLTWIARQKDAGGTWRSTQATILAMKALLSGTGRALGGDVRTAVNVRVNGQPAGTITVTPETSDVLQMLSLTGYMRPGRNTVRISQAKPVDLPYQLVGSYWVPWKSASAVSKKPLEIDVSYDRTRLKVNDTLTCFVKVRNNTGKRINMAIIDLGIPPGFAVDASAFAEMVRGGFLARYEVTGNQCILYVRAIGRGATMALSYSLKAKYPIRAKAPSSRVYEYYNPENADRTPQTRLVVE